MVQVDVDLSQYHDLGPNMKKVAEKGLNLTAQDLVGTLQKNSPVQHGLLKQWFPTKVSDTEYIIKSPAHYVGWVNYGHSQQPGRFIPGSWKGDRFVYKPGAKTGMVLKKSYVPGKKFVEKSIEQVKPRIDDHFKVAISEVLG